MMTKRVTFTAEEKAEIQKERLKQAYSPGSTIYTVVKQVSRNGMSRHIAVIDIVMGEARNISARAADILGWKWMDDGSVRVGGCGMDMGAHLVRKLSERIHGRGDAFIHRSL